MFVDSSTWGMISPKMTMPMVAPMTARVPPPPVSMSRVTVRVLLTRTLPSRMEQSRKLPIPRIGMMACTLELQKKVREDFTIMKKTRTLAYSWLKAPSSAFTFRTLLRHYAKRALTPQSLNVKLGPRRNYHVGPAAMQTMLTKPPVTYDFCVGVLISLLHDTLA